MWIPSWLWNNRSTFYYCSLAGALMRVCPTNLHVFCRLGEGQRQGPLGSTVGVLWEYGVSGPLLRAIQPLFDQCESCVRMLSIKSSMSCGCWTLPGLSLVYYSVCDFHEQDLKVQPWRVKWLIWEPQICIAGLCR